MPDPLHPAVVHFPIVLAFLAPVIAGLLAWAIYARRVPARGWLGVLILQAALVGSAWAAIETGEHEEDRVERHVSESLIEDHEEAAERFMVLAIALLLPGVLGLLAGRLGSAARLATVAASLGVLWSAADVGHRGGELVYRHGAANAYLDAGVAGSAGQTAAARSHHDHDDD